MSARGGRRVWKTLVFAWLWGNGRAERVRSSLDPEPARQPSHPLCLSTVPWQCSRLLAEDTESRPAHSARGCASPAQKLARSLHAGHAAGQVGSPPFAPVSGPLSSLGGPPHWASLVTKQIVQQRHAFQTWCGVATCRYSVFMYHFE